MFPLYKNLSSVFKMRTSYLCFPMRSFSHVIKDEFSELSVPIFSTEEIKVKHVKSEKLSFKELSAKVANKSKFSAVDVERVLDALSQVVLEEVLLSGRIVRIPRLGQFKERVYRKKNKETQESDVVIGKRSISFHASSRLSTTKNEKKGIRGKKL